jgi:hypothetical protein
VRLGRDPSGDTGEVRRGAGGWARVKSGFSFPILQVKQIILPLNQIAHAVIIPYVGDVDIDSAFKPAILNKLPLLRDKTVHQRYVRSEIH